jgi:hypothetical protein
MAKVKYDVTDAPVGHDFDTPVPKGLYRCKINDVTEGESKSSGKPMLTVEYEITQKGDWKGRRLWDYIVLEDSSAWKLRQFVEALGLKAKGTLDTSAALGERLLVRVKHETDDRDPDNVVVRSRVGNVTAIPEDTEEEEAEEEEPEDEEEEGEDEELTYEELEGYDRDELEELIEDEDLDVTFNKRTSDEKLLERVAEELDLEPEEEGEEEEGEEEEPEEDYEDMTIADLTALLKERGLSTKTKQKGPRKKALFIKRLEKDDEEDDGEEPF